MKYLKFFESWEKRDDGSVYWKQEYKPWDYTEQMIEELKELLLPIRDLGYKPYIQDNTVNSGPVFKEPSEIVITFLTYLDNKPLEITEDIIYDFDRINDYLVSKGFQISVKGTTVLNVKIELDYQTFINKYLNIQKTFKSLIFEAKRVKNYN